MFIKISLFVVCYFLFSISFAGENIQDRKITSIGCHTSDGTCFITLSGEFFGSTLNCKTGSSNQFRIENTETPHSRRAYASLLTAFVAKKTISVYIDGCTSQGYSKLSYYFIK